MKVMLLSNNFELVESIRNVAQFNETIVCESLDDVKDADVVIIDGAIVSHNVLSEFYSTHEIANQQTVFYVLPEILSQQLVELVTTICEAKKITIVPPRMTTNQIVEKIVHKLFPDVGRGRGNVIAFFGADSKVGTSMVSHAIAEMLEQNTSAKIGLFLLNDSMRTHFMKVREGEDIGLDDIKIELMNQVLTTDKLMQTCIKRGRLYVLQGPRYQPNMRHFHPEDVELLLTLASKELDLILLDAGSNLQMGLSVGALRAASHKYLVTTQQEVPRLRFELIKTQLFKALQLQTTDFMLIINQFIEDSSIYSRAHLADLYKMPLAGSVTHLEFKGWQAEVDKQTLLHYDVEEYNRDINALGRLIANQQKIEYKGDLPQKGSIWDRFLKKGRGAM